MQILDALTRRVRADGKVTFNKSSPTDERFKPWLKIRPHNTKIVCSPCNSVVSDVAKIDVGTLASHAQGAKKPGKNQKLQSHRQLLFSKK